MNDRWWTAGSTAQLRQVLVVPTGHAARACHELREERQVVPDEHHHPSELGGRRAVHPTGDFWPPVMHASNQGKQHATHHDVVEVRNYEVGVVKVHVGREGRQEQAGETTDGEDPQERQRVQHRCIQPDAALVEGRDPRTQLDCGRQADAEGEQREDGARQLRLARHEHVVAPDKEADRGDCNGGRCDGSVAEDVTTAVRRMSGNHRKRAAPSRTQRGGCRTEEVLEQDRVTAQAGIEDTDSNHVLEHQRNRVIAMTGVART